jgi:uncharacterized protein YhaN
MALRIERMDFSPWGCFEDHSVTFSPRPGDVELIHGPNASGKSTASRGERSLLYGIDARTPDNHTYDYRDLRIGACLQLDGKRVELARRKRRAGSLVGPDGEALPEDPIAPALRGLTEQVYRALFQVDHDTLVQGGAELLQGEGEVGSSLFSAAAGVATLHGTLADLDAEAERMFNPRARTTVLHKALAGLRDAEQRLREAMLRPSRHRDMRLALKHAEGECEALTRQARELELEARTLERKRAVVPLLDAHAERVAELAGLAGTPDLPDSAATQRSAAQGRVRAGTVQLERVRLAATTLDGEIETIVLDETVVARGEEIHTVQEGVSAIGKAAGDRRKREGELHEARAGLKNAAAIVGVEPSEIEPLRRPATARRALDGFLSDHDELASRRASALAHIEETTRTRDQAQADLDNAPLAADTRELDPALAAAQRAGAISEQLEESRLQAGLQRRDTTERLARLRPAPPSIDGLRSLAAPSRETARRMATRYEDLRRAAERLATDASRVTAEETSLAEERESLVLAGEAPTAEALASARESRDVQWSAIRATAPGDSPPTLEAADRFERALADADHVADARTDHAAQIERTAAAQARAVRLGRERAALAEREAGLHAREATLSSEWAAAWAVTGLAALEPEDALSWLDERDAILDLDRAATKTEARVETQLARERGHRDALAAQLSAHGCEIEAGAVLDALIARGKGVVADAQHQAAARLALQTALSGAQRAVAAAEHEQRAVAVARSAWETAWPQRRTEAGLPATATPAAAHEIVRAVNDGLGCLERSADLERRIAGIDSDRAEFQTRVRRLCEDLAPDLLALDPERAAGALHTRLADHERRQTRREDLLERRAAVEHDLTAIEAEIATAQAEIDSLLAAAGCDDATELPELEARAARAGVLRGELAEYEQQIAEVGEGRFDDLAEGAVDFDRERAALELAELHEQVEGLRQQRDESKEAIGERKSALAEAETDTAAVQAAQDAELARAAVREAAIGHAKAKLAATVVRRAIDRYRRLHQDPLLRRANELFGRFTLGSFVELFVDFDEHGQGVLIGRQRDRVLKRVPAMSKGTREQLFLALRIAAIERYVTTSGPVPVVFDDVFLESDEPRSERIFEALGELATKTQVIALTHHRHLIEVGKRALRDKLAVQDLPDAAPALREAAAA